MTQTVRNVSDVRRVRRIDLISNEHCLIGSTALVLEMLVDTLKTRLKERIANNAEINTLLAIAYYVNARSRRYCTTDEVKITRVIAGLIRFTLQTLLKYIYKNILTKPKLY